MITQLNKVLYAVECPKDAVDIKIENNKYLQYDCYELKATSPNIKLPESN